MWGLGGTKMNEGEGSDETPSDESAAEIIPPASEEESNEFRFELGDDVEILVSGDEARVIGCAYFESRDDEYLLRYTENGVPVERWWTVDALGESQA